MAKEVRFKNGGVLDLDNPPKVVAGDRSTAWTEENLGAEAYAALAIEGGYFDPTREGGYRPCLDATSYHQGRYHQLIKSGGDWQALARRLGHDPAEVSKAHGVELVDN